MNQTIAVPEFPIVAMVASTFLVAMLVFRASNTVGRTRRRALANNPFESSASQAGLSSIKSKVLKASESRLAHLG